MAKKIKKVQDSSRKSELPGIPVVTVLGHVDHGKTSLLDVIRKSNIAEREHGGITQKIGASEIQVKHDGRERTITFIDTPGHEAFSKMRSRGINAADIGLLVIAANDGIMPQTKESIDHLKASKIPFIVVITKIDLPDKNVDKVKQQVEKEDILLEGRGGDTPIIEVSAKMNTKIHELLELILLVYDTKQTVPYEKTLKKPFQGIIIESKLHAKSGPLATLIVRQGSVTVRDDVVCEGVSARVKSLIDDKGRQVGTAAAGFGVEVMGFTKVPPVGGLVYKKGEVADLIEKTQEELKEYNPSMGKRELAIILCADTLGSLEAITAALSGDMHIVSKKTGDISEADVLLAKSTGAIILGFNTHMRPEVVQLASVEKVLVKNYTIIYELLDEIQDVLEGKQLALEEKIFGSAKILATFPFEKTKVLGIKVMEGRIARGDKIRILRDEEIVGESMVTSLRQGKEQTSKVEAGREAGIVITPLLDFTIGDMVLSHS